MKLRMTLRFFPWKPSTFHIGDSQGCHRQVALRPDVVQEAALGIAECEKAQFRGLAALTEKVGHDVGDHSGFGSIMPRET